jgi:hypothetical protein
MWKLVWKAVTVRCIFDVLRAVAREHQTVSTWRTACLWPSCSEVMPTLFFAGTSHARDLHACLLIPARVCSSRAQSRWLGARQFLTPLARLVGSDNDGGDDEDFRKTPEGGVETPVSRRLFVLGVSATGTIAVNQAVQLWDDYYGDHLRERLTLPFQRAFPYLFEPVSTEDLPSTRRAPLNPAFAKFFFDAHADVACDQLHLLSRSDLEQEESARAFASRDFFFPKGHVEPEAGASPPIGLELAYNFKLYCRVHSIGAHTSPQMRVEFSRALGAVCLAYIRKHVLKPRGITLPAASMRPEVAKDHADDWLLALRAVLEALVSLGWITEFKISDFDYDMWNADGRGELTVDSTGPVTLQSAMLIGEEKMEEISPKISGIMYNVLMDYNLTNVSLEDFYFDLKYQKDYTPQQLVTQFNFSLPKQ